MQLNHILCCLRNKEQEQSDLSISRLAIYIVAAIEQISCR